MQRKREQLTARFGDRKKFLKSFNPDLQMTICGDSELCIFGDAPTLSMINIAYGEMTATMWLVPQLYDLSEFCGCKNKLEGRSLEECANVIATDYCYLKVSEIMLFMYRFKSGRYGRFYGAVDPLVITTSLQDFIKERNIDIDRHIQDEQMREREREARNAITYEEHCRKHGKPVGANPLHYLANVAKR